MPQKGYSRLRRNIKKSNSKTIAFSFLGIVIFLGIMLKGFPFILDLIGRSSQLLNRGEVNKPIQDNLAIINPPSLIDIPNATSSATIKIKGFSDYEGTVTIFLNDNPSDEIEVEKDNEFESRILRLKDGKNTVSAKIKTEESESDYSDFYEISYVQKDPTLEIGFPQDGANFVKADKRITIQGKTEESNTVTINGTRAIVEFDGSFSHLFELSEGSNEITISATNPTGSKTEKKINTTYSRE